MSQTALDQENRERLELLIEVFREQITAVLAGGRDGEVHAVADVRAGRLTPNSHVSPTRLYPIRRKGETRLS